ncbi:sigma-54-dependent transcriptional regulator [Desulfotalea psychrophila]|uniref:Related to two-component system response regulator (Ntr family) n=1 Tax=Desulfotalea psychrophila (strain LSv54 / DSM 12343) TaxID=177439 RepID=Q6AJC8_DESPS|nr:sigma-54 dependent transcriptional regulator [Desulfotalea psychrophila]CAG37552.1 related to two-component system response regulator (Ntr family) [Desulfotalea psychrophila LSv54]
MAKRVLIIDDEASIRITLQGILEDEGFQTLACASAEEGIELLEKEIIDIVLLDIWLGDNMDGLTALEIIHERFSLPVIMISGHGNVETAVQATKKGAFDFIEKPLSYEKILVAITNGLRFANLEKENILLRENRHKQTNLTGKSAAIQIVKKQIATVAPTEAWVLIRGEHGTGKELVAQSIHSLSRASNQPMVEINCAAIPEELIESELFGHEKGSFTGAHNSKRGKFDQANGGILFLDEIGDMSMTTQSKILRILQEQKFERVGGNKTIKVNVRVLAATNKNLEEEIEAGNFRADLFWRLNVVPIHVPPLKERMEDIPLLVENLLEQLIHKGLQKKTFGEDAYRALQSHDWPGNVRELRNFIERVVIMTPGEVISGSDTELFLMGGSSKLPTGKTDLPSWFSQDYKTAKKIFEKKYLKERLEQNDGNVSRTAEQVGLERSHLHKKLKSLEIID